MTSDVRAALERVLERIGTAAARAGRDASQVRLVAVSKTVGIERLRAALACGQTVFGENRLQEARPKIDALGPAARWHLVGHLQRNKARHAVGAFELIHGVDDLALAEELERRAAAVSIRQPVLVQVNLAEEATKSGTSPAALAALIDGVAAFAHLELRGLMTIPPPADDPEQARPWFRRLRALRDELRARTGRPLDELSMGMTDDFEIAIEEGATLVRIGRAIFGERPA